MSLRARDLAYSADGRPLLEGASLDLAPGRVLAVLGPNGAGKSTLLRLLSGELRPHRGTVELEGRALSSWNGTALAQRRAVVAQRDSLSFSFTASEVVTLGRLPHHGEPASEQARIVEQALHRVDAGHLAARRYPTLSGGERARVQLARALAQIWQPMAGAARYLLLDEPTASQDLAHQHRCLQVVRRTAAEGVAVLVVLHDPNLVLDYADEVLLLCCGQIVAAGEPREILRPELLERVYGIPVRVAEDAASGRRWIQVRTEAA